jgi:SecD/SecF fusion protein
MEYLTSVNGVLFIIAMLAAIACVAGLVLERKLLWKSALVITILAFCGASLWPPATQLKKGIDLEGGTSVLYDVTVPDDVDARQAMKTTVSILSRRVDPQGVRNLVWRIEQGNRIEIQMPRPSDQVTQAREAYDDALEAILEQNVSRNELLAAFGAEPGRRQQLLADLERGIEQRSALFSQAAEAWRQLQALRADYRAVADDEEKMIIMAQKVAAAELQFDQTVDQIMATNVDSQALANVLTRPYNIVEDEQTGQKQIDPDTPLARGLADLKQAHPTRAGQLEELENRFAAYMSVKGPLDDVEDLIRLLKGAGVLEFRIAVQTAELVRDPEAEADAVTPQQIQQKREELRTQGPRGASIGSPMVWMPVDDIRQWINDSRARELLDEDPQAFFAQLHGVIGQQYGEDYYLLLWNTPAKSMTHRPSQAGWGVSNVKGVPDENFAPAVAFSLNSKGASLMSTMTGHHVKRAMSIVLDEKVLSAPRINTRLAGNIQVSGGRGGFSPAEQRYLVNTLQAGSLDARLSEEPIAIRKIGSQYGEDNLKHGLEAARDALIAVAIFMIIYYFFSGAVAVGALLANIVIILGVMSMVQAAFTMPGIAGVVLTIGMCVDANVLVFERIREELRRGVDISAALRLGYGRALSAIIDGNITNLIVCVILYQTASAEVRGFAVTLGIGICATLFTSLFMTRVIFEIWSRVFGMKDLKMLPAAVPAIDRALHPAINWLSKRFVFFTISAVLIVVSLGLCFMRGEDLLDIEFRGGTEAAFDLKSIDGDDSQRMTLPRADVEARLKTVGGWFEPDFDPATLNADDRATYDRLKDMVAERRQVILEEELAKAEREGQPVDQAQLTAQIQRMTNLAQLNNVTVVAVGETTEDFQASSFSVVTVISDSRTVAGVIKELYGSMMDVTRPVDFEADQVDTITANAPVYPVTEAALSEAIGRTDIDAQVPEFVGGVAIVLDQMSPATTLEDIEQRVRAMRLQPDYEDQKFRPTKVVGLTPAAGEPGKFTAAAVLVQDSALNWFDPAAREQWEADLAQREWSLVRDAMQRDTSLSKVSNFTATVAETIRDAAIVALGLSFVAIIAYIWFRFGSFRYGLASIAALAHDVTIAMGFIALSAVLYNMVGGNTEWIEPYRINLGLIAALLTIIGYSLNDTIVVFDRIRENRGKLATATPGVINDSINQTISRTLLTSGTTLLAVVMLYVFGGAGIREFAWALIIGVLVGTYSSVAIAAPLLTVGTRVPGKSQNPSS